jgi:hypothetical protein
LFDASSSGDRRLGIWVIVLAGTGALAVHPVAFDKFLGWVSLARLCLYMFASKANLAVSSIEFWQCKFEKREIGIRSIGGSGHGVMISL